jgi:hypothetical protein
VKFFHRTFVWFASRANVENREDIRHYHGDKASTFSLTQLRAHAIVWLDAGSSEYFRHGHVPDDNRHKYIHATFWRVGSLANQQS